MKILFALLASIVPFLLGLFVAHYQVFPYSHIKSLKQLFFPLVYETDYQAKYRLRQISKHTLLADKNFDALFVGDSITAEANWSELYPYLRIANVGINGDSTQGLIDRLDTIRSINAPKVFLMVGINDIFQNISLADIEKNYQVLIESLKQKNNTLYLFSCLYVGETYQRNPYKNLTKKITGLNEFIKELASNIEGVIYIDVNTSLSLEERLNPIYTNDDLHLTGKAYSAWKAVVDHYINSEY